MDSSEYFPRAAVIYNIPFTFDTFCLREYFSNFIEDDGFILFHYKNRPESSMREVLTKHLPDLELEHQCHKYGPPNLAEDIVEAPTTFDVKTGKWQCPTISANQEIKVCTKSVFLLVNPSKMAELVQDYHGKPWLKSESKLRNKTSLSCFIKILPRECKFFFFTFFKDNLL